MDLHGRGCRKLSPWHGPAGRGAVPELLASVSSDVIGVSRVANAGLGLEGPAVWRAANPHGAASEVGALCWESGTRLWSADSEGKVKLWDVQGAAAVSAVRVSSLSKAKVSGLEAWPSAHALVAAHPEGLAYVDARAGVVVQQQYTKAAPAGIGLLDLGHGMLFVGVGRTLCQYDTRAFAGGLGAKPKAVGTWELPAAISSVSCARSAGGNILAAAGCEDGRVAALDTEQRA